MIAKKFQRGFTIIELLVALGLGVMLSAGIIQIFDNNRRIANTETGLSRIQESGRFALDVMLKDVRQAGFHGCSDPHEYNITVSAAGTDASATSLEAVSLRGFEVSAGGNLTPAPGATNAASIANGGGAAVSARPGSDVLQISFGVDVGYNVFATTAGTNFQATIDPASDYCLTNDDYAIIADCSKAELFKVAGGPACNGNVTIAHGAPFATGSFVEDSLVLRYVERIYYVGDTGRISPAGDPVYALFLMENGNVEELIEGVEFLEILYGETMGANNVRYVTADNVGNMSKVVSIRIGMLVQSLENVRTDDDTSDYLMPGETIGDDTAFSHSSGRYLRRQFSATVLLRNRRS